MGETGKRTGFYLSELTHPYYIIKDAGYAVHLASPLGGPSPIDPTSLDMDDPSNQRFFQDVVALKGGQTTKKLADVDLRPYQAIVFAGGHGTMWDFSTDESVKSAIATIYEQGGIVAAACHGPAALVDVKLSDGSYLVEGKQVAVFTDKEEEIVELADVVPYMLESKLVAQGATSVSKEPWQDSAVADGRLITGQNPQSATSLGELVVQELQNLINRVNVFARLDYTVSPRMGFFARWRVLRFARERCFAVFFLVIHHRITGGNCPVGCGRAMRSGLLAL